MRNFSFLPLSIWFKYWIALMFVVLTTNSMSSVGTNITNDMSMTVRLVKQKGHLAFEISILNKTSTELHLGFSDCPLVYVLHVGNKGYNYPEKQPFAPAKICSSSLRLATLPPNSSVVVITAGVYSDLERALVKAKGYYFGEFRFAFSTTTSKKILQLIYKRKLR